jgi:hypothetical protein
MGATLCLERWYDFSTTFPRMLASGGSGKGDTAVLVVGRSAVSSVGCSLIVFGALGPVEESETFEVEALLCEGELVARGWDAELALRGEKCLSVTGGCGLGESVGAWDPVCQFELWCVGPPLFWPAFTESSECLARKWDRLCTLLLLMKMAHKLRLVSLI